MEGGAFSTSLGFGGVLVNDGVIIQVILPFGGDRDRVETLLHREGWSGGNSPLSREVSDRIIRYFRGEPVPFHDLPVDERGISPFVRSVREYVRGIPYGSVATYRDVALGIGSAAAVRAVGRVMATNPLPLVIPCHRVVGSDGSLRGFSAEGGVGAKRSMLIREGVSFRPDGRVELDRQGGEEEF
ncbi:MAG: methylated-DNA--[protein]-cysteine S-methyltransferase [Desulfuromonadia bacterium]